MPKPTWLTTITIALGTYSATLLLGWLFIQAAHR